MIIVMNPGTGARDGALEANAITVAQRLSLDLGLPIDSFARAPSRDDGRGYFGFLLIHPSAYGLEVDIPGDDPVEVVEGRPFKSRRLYVAGSSWWYGYALSIIQLKMKEGSDNGKR